MKLALELTSQEAYLGIGLGAVVFIAYLLLRNGGPPRNTNHIVNVQASPGAQVLVDKSKRTRVDVKANVSIQRAAPPPAEPKPRPSRSGSNGSGDDAMGIGLIALFVMSAVGLFYLRNFEAITYWSRVVCFASGTYALLYGSWDLWNRGVWADQIQWTYLLVLLVSGTSASFLLQAQELISADWVQAAVAQQKGPLDLFMNRLPRDGWRFVTASLLCTMVVFFVGIASLLATLRAQVLSLQDETPSPWIARKFIDVTEWVQPIPFMLISTPSLGFVVFILYFWLPQGPQT